MWGGTADRNLVSSMKGLPTSWDVKTKKNIKWVAELGSQSYGNPVVANGIVLVGTNNEAMQDPAVKGDKGILMAFRESDGTFLWQAVHDKLTAGRANDWPFQGICSSPLVENGIAYYVSNRGEVVAVDIEGFRDKGENDGPFKDEKQTRETDADIIWRYDMMDELGVFQHNMANSSPVDVREPDLRQHVERPGREPRQRAVAEVAGDHRARQDDRQAGVGRRVAGREHPARPVVVARGRQDRRHGPGRHRSGRRLGPRLRGQDRQEALGVRHEPQGLGLAEDPQRSHQHAGHLRRHRLHRQRPGSRARRRRRTPLRDRPDQDAATSPRAAGSGTTTRSGARSRPARSTTASCSIRISAASSTPSTSRPASRSGRTTCSRRSGDRRLSSTARSTSATRTATSRSSTPTGR